jgi:DNA-binding LacI/PurR family transcriptional regulator
MMCKMSNSIKNRRLTIGLAIDDIVLVGGQKTLRGAVDVARERGVNLICFHLNLYNETVQMPASWDSMGEITDGLIVYQAWRNEETFAAFRDHFPSLPMINALRNYEGCPSVILDSHGGMMELVRHLIEVHDYHRIAFISGPEKNFSAQERYRGYVDALSEHNLPLDPDLVTPNLGWDHGREAISMLIDDRRLPPGTGFEAIAATNDTLALNILDELRTRGIQVPSDIAVVGFDDDSRAFFSTPPLTTAGYDIGRHTTETLLALLAGEQVPKRAFVPVKVVIRRSCGCQYSTVTQAAVGASGRAVKRASLEEIVAAERVKLLADMSQVIGDDAVDSDVVSAWMERVLDGFFADLAKKEKEEPSAFLPALEKVLNNVKEAGHEQDMWHGVLSILRRRILPHLNHDVLSRAESLWQQARVLIGETARREQTRRASQAEQRSRMLREIETALRTTLSVTVLMDILAQNLPRLGIPSFYVALYEEPQKPNSPKTSYERSRLALAYDDVKPSGSGKVKLDPAGLQFHSSQLLPEGMLPNRQYCFVIEPLYFQERQLGFVVFELGPLDGEIYESLRGQISSALQGTLLLEQVQKHAVQLDTIVAHTLKTSEEMQRTISETSRQAQAVSKTAQVSIDVSKTGNDAVANTITGMGSIRRQVEDIAQSILVLSRHTRQIGEITRTMEDIAAQSNILSINASIQAARYGSKGLGFTVVAREMRQLAEQSREATTKITYILNEIQSAANTAVIVTEEGSKGVQQGMKLAGYAGEAIHNLSATIEEAARMALQISHSTDQQANAIDQLVKAVKSIKDASTQTSSSFKEVGL